MPREQRAVVETASGPNGLVASAVRLTGRANGGTKKPPKPPAWYMRAWDYYDTIGEYRYAVTWVGNLLSRATLEVWEDGELTKNPKALEALEALFGGAEGQREMLRQLGTHLTVTGDSYIIGEDMGEEPNKWQVVAASRVSNVGRTESNPGTWKIDKKELNDPLVIRLWRPHPLKADAADSPSRAVLNILNEIEGFTKHVDAQIASRLTGAGILTIPSEITFGTVRGIATEGEAATASSGIDAFLREFMATVSVATVDPGDASARVPIILQGPGEFLDKVQLITLWTELDAQAKELRDEAIRRLALGMDMPPEILTGTGEMNHWNSWQVEEASIKSHTEPLLQIITTDLSKSYLRAYLVDQGMTEEEARRFSFHADTSKIRLRPNRSKEAIELYNLGELSAEAMLRENGFDPADAMGEEERTTWLTKKVAGGSTTPELVAHALSLLGVKVPAAALVMDAKPTEAPSDPSLLQHPTRDLPERNDDAVAAAASAHVVVYRALERAGSRLKTKYKGNLVPGAENVPNDKIYRYAHITEDMLDDLLAGAWDCLAPLGVTTAPVVLDEYTRGLLRKSDEFTRSHFTTYLKAF